ncbi:unnamed protein product [Calicophoron daubneyi]|uniref:Glucosidase 2 subunit beta n=1 Tax=Calicophoron daubneyi TaxID=300641 RepID=A0AAV2TTI2_CALDB
MGSPTSYFFTLLAVYVTCGTALELPRGVPLRMSSAYRIGEPFTSLDGLGTVPWYEVNDDYCDLADGSDEPGTTACNNGVFFCRDVQYKTTSIPTMFVNDGVCDCCDGSDEYDGRTQCNSTCSVLAAAVREARSIRRNEIEQGCQLFKEYLKKLEATKLQKLIAEEKAAAALEAEKNQSTEKTPVSDEAQPDQTAPPDQEQDKKSPDHSDEHGDDVKPADEHDEKLDQSESESSPQPESEADSQAPPVITEPPKPIDYGPKEGFRMLTDLPDCLEFSDRSYTYQLCPFREIFQRDLGSQATGTSLGKWHGWAYAEDDYLKENQYAVMLFTDGLECWNGPRRSTKVHVYCGEKNELMAAEEPSRCEYVMHLKTPAACFDDPDVIFKRVHPED